MRSVILAFADRLLARVGLVRRSRCDLDRAAEMEFERDVERMHVAALRGVLVDAMRYARPVHIGGLHMQLGPVTKATYDRWRQLVSSSERT